MNTKQLLFSAILIITSPQLLSASDLNAKEDPPKKEKINYFGVAAGYNMGFYQNNRMSNALYTGSGFSIGLNYERRKEKSIFNTSLNFGRATLKNKPSNSTISMMNAEISMRYLRSLGSPNLFIGAKLSDDLNFSDFQANPDFIEAYGLSNSKVNVIQSIDFSISMLYKLKPLNGKLEVGLDISLFSIFKHNSSFAAQFPIHILDGEFNFQDKKLLSPTSFNGMKLGSWGSNIQLSSSVVYRLTNRHNFIYDWSLRRLSDVKGYPFLIGNHVISYRFNF